MGKVRTRILGLEDLEKQQKEEQKKRAAEKKRAGEESAEAEETKKEEVKETKKDKKEKKSVVAKKKGKKHREALKKVDASKAYTVTEAIVVLKKIKYAGFDESVELHLNLDETGLKGEVYLPHSTGKTVRVSVVSDEVLSKLEKGIIDFDVLVTHPSFMPKLAKFAKVLGPKGLMPNPKAGTVSTNPDEVVKKFSKGVLRWKSEPKFPLLHQMVGKISTEEKALEENVVTFLKTVGKPHIKAAYLKTTMSPSVKLDLEVIFA